MDDKKNKSRREFIDLSIKAGIALPLLGTSLMSCDTTEKTKTLISKEAKHKLKILILGGTSFLGPHQIAYAMERGHSITTFTRGKSKPTIHEELFDQVEQLTGDRKDNLKALENRTWDVVIDNSGHDAQWTKDTATLLKDSCDLYVYTSSTGVYYPYVDSEFKETSEVLMVEPEGITDEQIKIEYWYGVMKSNSEQEAIKQFGKDRVIVVRPTYMIGPADKTNRFLHWPLRLSRGGEVLVPGKEDDMVQYIDVRDVAEWTIKLIEEKKVGTYNAVGPKDKQNMYSFIEESSKAFDVSTSFVKIDDFEFLKENQILYIVPWIMPEGSNVGSAKINNELAKKSGLTFRPISDSLKDTLDWWNSTSISQEKRDEYEQDPKSVLNREKEILLKWKALQKG